MWKKADFRGGRTKGRSAWVTLRPPDV